MKVFYRPEQSAHNAASYSPSAGKPAQVVADWLDRGVINADDVIGFEPVDNLTLAKAHDVSYVYDVMELATNNGFGNRDPEVARSLLYTNGSFLAAAEYAVLHNTHTCSPTSGFHHAGFGRGGGFCTFNGLMVAAIALKEAGLVQTVAILDCDAHYGDGTQDIIDRLGIDWIKHYTFGRHFRTKEDVGHGGRRFLSWLREAVEDCQGVSLVMYQAGADPHVRDPLGGMLGTKAMMERDFEVRRLRNPLVWNLAGGYQRSHRGDIGPVLSLHRQTAEIWTGKFNG